jgi:hypothetical protein
MKQKYNIGDVIYTIWCNKGVIIKERENNVNYYDVYVFRDNTKDSIYNKESHIIRFLHVNNIFKTKEEAKERDIFNE